MPHESSHDRAEGASLAMSEPGTMTTRTLGTLPSLGGLYARALTDTLAARLPGRHRHRATDLPALRLRVPVVKAERTRLAAYQRLVGEPVSDTLPAGYVHVLSFPLSVALMNDPGFPLSLFGLVHLSNRVTYLRPHAVGEPFTLTSRMTNLRAHRRGLQLDAVAEASAGGELAWRGVSTYLARDAPLPPGMAPAVDESPDRPRPPELPTAIWRLPADTGRRYARVSGDGNPIHLTRATAKLLGFKRQIVHGMYSAARALAAVGAARGPTYDWDVTFAAPVYLPATVSFAQRVSHTGFDYVGWDAAKDRVHFTGTVTPRPPA